MAPGRPTFSRPVRKQRLPGDERRAPGGAGLLRVVVGEDRAFLGDAVDVGRAIAHHAAVVGADVPVADVVAEDDEDVGFCRSGLGGSGLDCEAYLACGKGADPHQGYATQ